MGKKKPLIQRVPRSELTEAGKIMRDEMSQPKKLDEVLVETLGGEKASFAGETELSVEGLFQQQIKAMAEQVIHDTMDPAFTLRLEQWQHVQAVVEEALKAGWARGRASR